MKSKLLALALIFQMGTLWAADLNSAKELYAKKDYSAAIPVLQELVEKTPQNVQVNEMLAVSLYKTGKHEQAKKYFEVAQKRGNAEAMLYLANYKYDAYDFDGCEELISNYATALKKTNKEMGTEGNRMAAKVSRAKDMINHVEKIVVFDSLVVAKKDFFKSYKISPDVGYIKDSSVLPSQKDAQNDQPVYCSSDQSHLMWASKDSDGIMRLMECNKLLDGSWDTPVQEDDVLNDDGDANYPFLMPDGQTLYYASNGSNSIGGYDIFVSRKDDDSGSFLAPQNVGMPFNSPYDDYLLAIDEQTGIGWWATDRNQIADSLTIYMFKPNQVRVNYEQDVPNIKELASLSDIKLTWPENADFSDLKAKLKAIPSERATKKQDFVFYASKGVIYTTLDDAKTKEGRNLLEQYFSTINIQNSNNKKMAALREQFHSAKKADRQALSSTIIQLEKNIQKRQEEIDYLSNSIRRAEGYK